MNMEHCATVELEDNKAFLNDVSCDAKFRYICEVMNNYLFQ
jgi:hypothetical protein